MSVASGSVAKMCRRVCDSAPCPEVSRWRMQPCNLCLRRSILLALLRRYRRKTMNKRILAFENSESAFRDFSWLINGLHGDVFFHVHMNLHAPCSVTVLEEEMA